MEGLMLLILSLISVIAAAPIAVNIASASADPILGDIHPKKAGVDDQILNRGYVPLENCKALQDAGFNETGLYTVQPNGDVGEFTVFCDMTLLEGGWTIFQRRINGAVNFQRKFSFYRNGFGSFFENFWLGLEKLYRLTRNANMELYIGLENFDGTTAYARYSHFSVENEVAGYTLRVGEFDKKSSAGDSLATHNGQRFSTHDRDLDALTRHNCAELTRGGWWYKDCHDSNLNGVWYEGGVLANSRIPDGIIWQHWTGDNQSLKTVVLAMRPRI